LHRTAIIGLLAGIFAANVGSAGDSATQKEASELLARAASLQNVWAKGGSPFHLHLQIHAERITAKPVDGTYEEIWLAPDKWRRETSFPGLTQVEIGDKDSKWVSRNVDFRPSVAYATSRALDNLTRSEYWPDEKATNVRTRKKNGVALRCVELQTGPRSRTLCFDPAGVLSSEETAVDRFEYSDYGPLENKTFPRQIQVYQSGNKVLEIRAEELSFPSKLGPYSFTHDSSAQRMATCERFAQEIPIKKVTPHYPESDRRARRAGTVILYAQISAEGLVQKVRVVQSVTPSLDQATIDAVQQWVYAPVQCGTVPLPTEREVSVNYALSPY